MQPPLENALTGVSFTMLVTMPAGQAGRVINGDDTFHNLCPGPHPKRRPGSRGGRLPGMKERGRYLRLAVCGSRSFAAWLAGPLLPAGPQGRLALLALGRG